MSETVEDRREVVYVVRVRPIGMPQVDRGRVERVSHSVMTVRMPGDSRLILPAPDEHGEIRATGQVRGVFKDPIAAHKQALAELELLRAEVERAIRACAEITEGKGG